MSFVLFVAFLCRNFQKLRFLIFPDPICSVPKLAVSLPKPNDKLHGRGLRSRRRRKRAPGATPCVSPRARRARARALREGAVVFYYPTPPARRAAGQGALAGLAPASRIASRTHACLAVLEP